MPTADDVARAVVAACQETGEDPVSVVTKRFDRCQMSRTPGGRAWAVQRHFRARLYAFAALVAEFLPGDTASCGVAKHPFARMVGAHNVASFLGTVSQRRDLDAAVLGRVRAAVRSGRVDAAPAHETQGGEAAPPPPAPVTHRMTEAEAVEIGRRRAAEKGLPPPLIAEAAETPVIEVEVSNLAKDDRVSHRKFGVGLVTAVNGNLLTVKFDDKKHVVRLHRDFVERLAVGTLAELLSAPKTPIATAVGRELVPLAARPVKRLVNGWAGRLDLRRAPSVDVADCTAELMGDPAPGRSALAGAAPWRPHEDRGGDAHDSL
jgi:hypothetical protein